MGFSVSAAAGVEGDEDVKKFRSEKAILTDICFDVGRIISRL
jgi:hypothetical protein